LTPKVTYRKPGYEKNSSEIENVLYKRKISQRYIMLYVWDENKTTPRMGT
jgi:hypothetical protein